MHDGSDGCVLILLSLGGALLLTVVFFATMMAEPAPYQVHHALPMGLALACLGAWVWTVGVVVVEAVHNQRRKRR